MEQEKKLAYTKPGTIDRMVENNKFKWILGTAAVAALALYALTGKQNFVDKFQGYTWHKADGSVATAVFDQEGAGKLDSTKKVVSLEESVARGLTIGQTYRVSTPNRISGWTITPVYRESAKYKK